MWAQRLLGGGGLRRAALVCFSLVVPTLGWAATAFIEGDATYLQRILPPADAVLIVTLEDTSRADAPSVELVKTQMRLGGGPPYPWRLGYDTGLVTPQQRIVVRGRIMAAGGLWMTTDEAVSAFEPGAPLSLRLVMAQTEPPPLELCAAAKTQGEMTQCAYDDFLEASSGYAASHAALAKRLPPARRAKLLRMQSSWLQYRTKACDFESSAVEDGSLKPFVNWRCAARLTRERAVDVSRLATCREGDAACAGPRQ